MSVAAEEAEEAEEAPRGKGKGGMDDRHVSSALAALRSQRRFCRSRLGATKLFCFVFQRKNSPKQDYASTDQILYPLQKEFIFSVTIQQHRLVVKVTNQLTG